MACFFTFLAPRVSFCPEQNPLLIINEISDAIDKRCDISAKPMRHFLEQHNAKHFHYLHWTVVDRSSLFLVSIRSLSRVVQIKGARSDLWEFPWVKQKEVWFFLNVFFHNLPIQFRTCLWISHVREIVFGLLLYFSLKDRITGVKKLIFHRYSYIKNSWSCLIAWLPTSRTGIIKKRRIILGLPDLNS